MNTKRHGKGSQNEPNDSADVLVHRQLEFR
jgi:hypothetical protein